MTPSDKNPWRGHRVAIAVAFAFNGMLFGVWASRVPLFKDRFDLDPAALGWLLLALAGGAILSFPMAGALSERWGASRLTLWCAAGYGPALALLALAPSAPALALALFAFGVFHGAMDVAMNGWGAWLERKMDRAILTTFHALFSLGAGLGAASGYAAARLSIPVETHFITLAALGGALSLATMIPVMGHDRPQARPGGRRLLAWPGGALLPVAVIAFASSMGEGAMADWSAVYLRLVTAATEAQAALGYAVFSATMVLARLAGGRATDRLGPVTMIRFSGAMAFAGLVLAMLAASLPVALAGFALVGLGYALVMPLAFSRAANDPHTPPGPALASVATLGYGGMLLGPPVLGAVAHLIGMRLSFALLAVLALVGFALAGAMRRPG